MLTTAQKIHILIIDDDEDDYFILHEILNSIPGYDFSVEWIFNYAEGVKRICGGDFDLCFIDYHLGAKTGLELINEAIGNGCEEPLILLTGKGNRNIDVDSLKAGAMDYLVKSEIETEKLERSIRYSIERAKSLKALKTNEKKFRNIFERSMDAVFTAARENLLFTDINNAGTELFEYSKDELMVMSLWELVEDGEEKEAVMNALLETGEINDKELVFHTKSGAQKYCILSISEESQSGEAYYQGIVHDITRLKKAEQETLRMEKRGVADRLVHVLAHEVRNPLNNINLSIEQLAPDLAGTDAEVYVEIISRNSKRISDLISELLSSSRPAQISQKQLPVQLLIDESISAANDRLTLKRISLEKNIPDTELMIYADADKMKIALLNIIINAIEAMEEGNGKLQINLEDQEEYIRLLISDNGCGISEENMSRLFEPYFTAKRNGMGIGLASTLNILQSHQAEVEVLSKLNEGTTFILTFRKLKEKPELLG
jgi:PAS domain S-box-containing protein